MTEPPTAAGFEEGEGRTYSKDYWDLVFEQLARRPLFKIGMAILALLYATAIYAPLIANDRPYVLEAVDYQAYKKAARMLGPMTSGVLRIAKQTEADYLASLDPAPDVVSTYPYTRLLRAQRQGTSRSTT